MSRHKSGCCGGNKNHTEPKTGCKHCGDKGSHSGCKRCGRKPPPTPTSAAQFKFTGTTRVVAEQLTVDTYLADPGTNFTAEANPQLYPIARAQDITTLSVNLLDVVPQGQQLDVEVLRDGVSLPIPLKVTYSAGDIGLKFLVAAPQTFNGADPASSRLDVRTTEQVLVGQPGSTVAPLRLSVVVG